MLLLLLVFVFISSIELLSVFLAQLGLATERIARETSTSSEVYGFILTKQPARMQLPIG